MKFSEIFGPALDRTPDDIAAQGVAPSIDLLSRSAFQDIVMDAKLHHMQKDSFSHIIADDPLMVFGGDPLGEPLPFGGSTDVSVVENLPERLPSQVLDEVLGPDPQQELGLDLVTNNSPAPSDIVRGLIRSA